MAEIPQRDGYAVELDTLTVHERYNDHARLARRVRPGGLANILGRREPKLCPTCFPPPAPVVERPSKRGRKPVVEPSESAVQEPGALEYATIDEHHITHDDALTATAEIEPRELTDSDQVEDQQVDETSGG